MGYLALFRNPQGHTFQVLQCHINVWALPGFPTYRFFFDVGLRLQAPVEHEVSGFEISVPFRTDGPDAINDLTSELINQTTAELIFGTAVVVNSAAMTLTYNKGDAQQERRLASVITPPTLHPSVPIEKARDFTLWSIKLTTPIPSGQERYVRFRFRIAGLGRTWQWGHYSALFNLRVCDMREAAGVAKLNERMDRILEIRRLNVFLIAPSELEVIVIEPELQYARLFEGENWEPYLRRKVRCVLRWWHRPKLAIYQWTNARTEPGGNPPENPPAISQEAPFRAYAQLRCWPARLPSRWVILIVILFIIVFYDDVAHALNACRIWIRQEIGEGWHAILAIGIVAIAKPLVEGIGKLPKIGDRLRNVVRHIDKWLYWERK